MTASDIKYFRQAYWLSLFTIFYNIAEGLISMGLGYKDESLALFGFGADSFIEVMSGIGIAIMILRIRRNPDSPRRPFEKTALRITGLAFYILTVGLIAGVVENIITQHKPETTIWGIVISLVSIAVMIALMAGKTRAGRKLNSEPILADARCTRICIYMSVVLLASSLLYELTGFSYADTIGALGLAYFSFSEGRESFEKAKGDADTCCCG